MAVLFDSCAQVSLALPAGDMVIEGDAGSPQPYPKDFIGFLDFLGVLGKDFGAFLIPLIYIYIYIDVTSSKGWNILREAAIESTGKTSPKRTL